jgi:hypothetical protein
VKHPKTLAIMHDLAYIYSSARLCMVANVDGFFAKNLLLRRPVLGGIHNSRCITIRSIYYKYVIRLIQHSQISSSSRACTNSKYSSSNNGDRPSSHWSCHDASCFATSNTSSRYPYSKFGSLPMSVPRPCEERIGRTMEIGIFCLRRKTVASVGIGGCRHSCQKLDETRQTNDE